MTFSSVIAQYCQRHFVFTTVPRK